MLAVAILSAPWIQCDLRLRSRIVLLLSVALFLVLAHEFRQFTVDDAYISLRYARNLADGFGLVYSTDGSTPVEGYTNFLWILLEAPLYLLRISDQRVLLSVKAIGIAFGLGIMLVSYALIRRITSSVRASALGALLVSAVPYLAFWSVGGLETAMYIFWLMVGLYAYISEQQKNEIHAWSMFFLTLMSLTRPEGLVVVAVLLAWEAGQLLSANDAAQRSAGIRRLVSASAIPVVIYGSYFIWRYHYYGFLLPNTFYARSNALSAQQLLNRVGEMWPFILYMLPVAVLAIIGYRRATIQGKHEKTLMAVILVCLIAASFASRREWMPGFRYELPFMPIVMVFAALGIDRLAFRRRPAGGRDLRHFIAGFGLLAATGALVLYPAAYLKHQTSYTTGLIHAHVALGTWLSAAVPHTCSYAGWDMGAVPYYSRLDSAIDIHPEGILSTYTTHLGYNVSYYMSLQPCFIVLPPDTNDYAANSIQGFYRAKDFPQLYQRLFTFAFNRDYLLVVYKRADLRISPDLLDTGTRLAEDSFLESYSTSR